MNIGKAFEQTPRVKTQSSSMDKFIGQSSQERKQNQNEQRIINATNEWLNDQSRYYNGIDVLNATNQWLQEAAQRDYERQREQQAKDAYASYSAEANDAVRRAEAAQIIANSNLGYAQERQAALEEPQTIYNDKIKNAGIEWATAALAGIDNKEDRQRWIDAQSANGNLNDYQIGLLQQPKPEIDRETYFKAGQDITKLEGEVTKANAGKLYADQQSKAVQMEDVITRPDFTETAQKWVSQHNDQYNDPYTYYYSEFMTDLERNTFAYYMGKGEVRKAYDYLDALEYSISQRAGAKLAEEVDNMSDLGRNLFIGAHSFITGADNAVRGLTQAGLRMTGSTKLLPTSANEIAQSDYLSKSDWGTRMMSGALTSAGNMLPSIAVSTLTGIKTLGSITLGLQSGGTAYAEAIREGKTDKQALGYALLTGASEAGLESALGGIRKLSNAAGPFAKLKGVLSKVAENGPLMDKLLAYCAEMGDEFVEEYLQEILEPVFRNYCFDENNQFKPFTMEALEAGLMGAMTAGVMNFPSAISDVREIRQQQKAIQNAEASVNALLGLNSEVNNAETKNAVSEETTRRITMEEFTNPDSSVWNNIPYEDTAKQTDIMQRVHNDMIREGKTVVIPESTLENVSQYYPDLKSMNKKERTPILKQKITELKSALRTFLSGIKGSYEFDVNGKTLDARLYDTGIREVLDRITKDKASALYSTGDIFQNARYLYSTPDYEDNPNIYRWNYFYTPVQIGQETVGVRIAVRDMKPSTNGAADSQIYHWGIKENASLGGGRPGTIPNTAGASSDALSDAANIATPDVGNNIPRQTTGVNTNQTDVVGALSGASVPQSTVTDTTMPLSANTGGVDAILPSRMSNDTDEANFAQNASESLTEAQTKPTIQERQRAFNEKSYELQRRVEEIRNNPNATQEEIDALNAEIDALDTEYNDIIREQRIANGKVSKDYNSPDNHIDNREMSDMGDRSIKAFQFDHPELHQYFVTAAQSLLHDAEVSLTRDMHVKGQGTTVYASEPLRRAMNQNLSRNDIIQVCRDIIANNGQENYAAAKRVEIILDDMLSRGYTTEDGRYGSPVFEANEDYIAAKERINGAVTRDSFDYYKAQNRLALETGEVTEDQLKSEWEAQNDRARDTYTGSEDSQGIKNSRKTSEDALMPSLTQYPWEGRQGQQEYNALADTMGWERWGEPTRQVDVPAALTGTPAQTQPTQQSKSNQPTQRRQSNLPKGTGAKEAQFGYDEALTQTRATDQMLTDEERQMEGLRPEDRMHQVLHNDQVDAQAMERYDFDYDGEKADLFSDGKTWDATDEVLAHMILENELDKARASGDYSDYIKLQDIYDKHGTESGRNLYERSRFARTPATLAGRAAKFLDGDNVREMTPEQKNEIVNRIYETATELDNIAEGDTASLIDLIRRLAIQRRTTGLFSKDLSNKMMSALEAVAERLPDADTFLRNVAAAQIQGLATDHAKRSAINVAKNYRVMSMLSKITTVLRNLTSNTVFDLKDMLSADVGVLADKLMSLATGTRSVAADKGWISKAKRQGSLDGFLKSFIQVGLDAEVSENGSKYELAGGRTNKMSGNFMERLLSTWEKYEGYALKSTDEFQKGGVKQEAIRGLLELRQQGKLNATDKQILDLANQLALERTFQNESIPADIFIGLRNVLNRVGVRDSRGGSFGVGDVLIPFAQVPGNLLAQKFNYGPIGFVKSLGEMAKVMMDARKGKATVEQQAKAARAFGRGLTGSAGIAMLVALALKGIIAVSDDDDKNKAALDKAQGRSGTQFNLSALLRYITGGSAEWQEGDDIVSVGFLEPLNAQMAMAAAIADAYEEDGSISITDIAKADIGAMYQSVMDLPAMSSISNLIDGYQYSDEKDTAGKLADMTGSFIGSQLSSFVPNILGGVASGTDNAIRDTRESKNPLLQGIAGIESKIPGLRQTLPVARDAYGNERQYTDSDILNFLNQNILPGQITNYGTDDISEEIRRLDSTVDGGMTYPDRKAPNSFSYDKTKYTLDYDERQEFQQVRGETVQQYIDRVMNSSAYKKMSDEDKAKVIKYCYTLAYEKAKGETLDSKDVDYKSDYAKALEAVDAGIDIAVYWQVKEYASDHKKNEEAEYIDSLKLPSSQRNKLYDLYGIKR